MISLEQLQSVQDEHERERDRYSKLEAKHDELKAKYSSVSAELSKLRFDQKSRGAGGGGGGGGGGPPALDASGEVKKPAWMVSVSITIFVMSAPV